MQVGRSATFPDWTPTTAPPDAKACNYSDNSVTVRGDAKAVAKFKADLRPADVPITVYWVKMHLVRFDIDANGKHSETIVMAPNLSTVANVPASCTGLQNKSGHSIFVTVSQNADKTVTLNTEVREFGDDGEIVSSGKNTRIVSPLSVSSKAFPYALVRARSVSVAVELRMASLP